MPARTLDIVNVSSRQTMRDQAMIAAITQAIAIQLRHVASAWGAVVWEIVDDANAQGFRIELRDNDAQDPDYGYHDVDPSGPFARVFLDPILEHGGRWLRSELSVSATVSHEACELVGDPAVNLWAQTARGALIAVELCDPVESDAYDVKLRSGQRVSVSNFVCPAWFNPFAGPKAVYDHMRMLERPFQVAAGGYVMRTGSGGVRNVYGRGYPGWKKATKRVAGSRTHARHQYGKRPT
jgi:hypothetical protein